MAAPSPAGNDQDNEKGRREAGLRSNRASASERPFEAQFAAVLGADDQVAALDVPLAGGAERHEEGLFDGHGGLVAALLRQGEDLASLTRLRNLVVNLAGRADRPAERRGRLGVSRGDGGKGRQECCKSK